MRLFKVISWFLAISLITIPLDTKAQGDIARYDLHSHYRTAHPGFIHKGNQAGSVGLSSETVQPGGYSRGDPEGDEGKRYQTRNKESARPRGVFSGR